VTDSSLIVLHITLSQSPQRTPFLFSCKIVELVYARVATLSLLCQCLATAVVWRAINYQRLLYSCLFRGRWLATGLHARMSYVTLVTNEQTLYFPCIVHIPSSLQYFGAVMWFLYCIPAVPNLSSLPYPLVRLLIYEYPPRHHLCGLVVRVLGYRSGGPGSIPGTTRKKE
jgi:hypothetical protein